jgi:HEAT repeat protein
MVQPESPQTGRSADLPRESTRTILFQFVVFPLGVVLIGVLIFVFFGSLAGESSSIEEYLSDIRSGSRQRRWQAAYQLTLALKRGEAAKYPNLAPEVRELYAASKDDDPQVRRYLSAVLGELKDRASVPMLVASLPESDPQTRIFAILALGQIGDSRARDPIARYAADSDPAVRKAAVFALGALGDAAAAPVLAGAVNDEVADVRWNAAIALSRFGDGRALPVLREMLDRARLDAVPGVTEEQKQDAMIIAMAPYVRLAGPEARPLLERISGADPNPRVQAAAREALATIR